MRSPPLPPQTLQEGFQRAYQQLEENRPDSSRNPAEKHPAALQNTLKRIENFLEERPQEIAPSQDWQPRGQPVKALLCLIAERSNPGSCLYDLARRGQHQWRTWNRQNGPEN